MLTFTQTRSINKLSYELQLLQMFPFSLTESAIYLMSCDKWLLFNFSPLKPFIIQSVFKLLLMLSMFLRPLFGVIIQLLLLVLYAALMHYEMSLGKRKVCSNHHYCVLSQKQYLPIHFLLKQQMGKICQLQVLPAYESKAKIFHTQVVVQEPACLCTH